MKYKESKLVTSELDLMSYRRRLGEPKIYSFSCQQLFGERPEDLIADGPKCNHVDKLSTATYFCTPLHYS